MNQVDTDHSKKVGSEVDIIIGFRNLFGFRRLGFEVRGGVFFPGNAFRYEESGEIRKADKSISLLSVIIW